MTPDTGGLAVLPGLEMVAGQLAPLITVLRAEPARRKAGIQISRPSWRNLVFTGGPGTGKSRAATAIACLYRDLGVLRYGNLIEIPGVDLAGASPRDTAEQIREAVKVTGDLVMITGAHAWHDLPDRGQHLLRCSAVMRRLRQGRPSILGACSPSGERSGSGTKPA